MLTLILLSLSAHAGNLPDVVVDWKGEHGTLRVQPPGGEHLAPEAPVDGWLSIGEQTMQLSMDGASLRRGLGLHLPGAGPWVVQGALRVSLCEDGGTTCRLVDAAFLGTAEGRKGSTYLAVTEAPPQEPEAPAEPPHGVKVHAPEDAFAEAKETGQLVLLDFTAVWCPPCQQLAAEVLHDEANALDLAPYVLAQVDADATSSWAIKDRYKVGGYPTIIVTRADGTEVDRRVGYPGEPEFVAWLDAVRAEGTLSLDELVAQADTLTPAEAGAAALRLARADREADARALLERADDGVDARLVRLALDPDDAQLAWLAENAPERIYQWGFTAMSVSLEPETRAAVLAAVDEMVPRLNAPQAADLLYLRAKLSPPDEARGWYAASAALLNAALTGDPVADRGQYTFLASLYAEVGDPERGLALLQGAIEAFPEEFTYHYAAAGLLMEAERYEEARPYAEAAVRYGYDDNRLRAVKRQAELLRELGEAEEALALLDETLEAAQRPDEGTEVRTHRYLDQLVELREDIASGR
ncbi:MAG: tetratricopeptide repeat protein [Alphaproteobacteria bacterium]|nr:tetratricopeptide repeat protein [Alphaproteobacteria bacterium]